DVFFSVLQTTTRRHIVPVDSRHLRCAGRCVLVPLVEKIIYFILFLIILPHIQYYIYFLFYVYCSLSLSFFRFNGMDAIAESESDTAFH
ncbi:unnamed protein product, partial [Larinioides sclopetarius]